MHLTLMQNTRLHSKELPKFVLQLELKWKELLLYCWWIGELDLSFVQPSIGVSQLQPIHNTTKIIRIVQFQQLKIISS
jgi:hypothetical protein